MTVLLSSSLSACVKIYNLSECHARVDFPGKELVINLVSTMAGSELATAFMT